MSAHPLQLERRSVGQLHSKQCIRPLLPTPSPVHERTRLSHVRTPTEDRPAACWGYSPPGQSSKTVLAAVRVGGAGGTRTPDPLNAIEVLSQLSYSPTVPMSMLKAGRQSHIRDARVRRVGPVDYEIVACSARSVTFSRLRECGTCPAEATPRRGSFRRSGAGCRRPRHRLRRCL